MLEAIIITPVKDSLETLKRTVQAIASANKAGNIEYHIFNDFSQNETREYLEKNKDKFNFHLTNLEEITTSPSPNYKLVLQKAQELALGKNVPLGIIESDVVIKKETLSELIDVLQNSERPGVVGAITVDETGNYNFPYTFEKVKSKDIVATSHSLSFCCTLISKEFLQNFNFTELADNKDWFDVFISRQSLKMGFINYLAKGTEVLHLPHSSRPWKNLKYKNPVLYYIKKLFLKRDRI